MGCQECVGRYGLLVCAVIFSVGMLISTLTPSWIETTIEQPDTGLTTFIAFGPFSSQSRECKVNASTGEAEDCTDWISQELGQDDCLTFSENEDIKEKLCRQHNTWRVLAMLCMLIVVGTAILVAAATCTQCVTCGCCGGSFDMIASIAYWLEVAISIVCWSFCISVVMIIRDEDFTEIVASEAENIGSIQNVKDITDGNFLWGFWLFIFSGTFVGSLCAIFADWAAEGSLLRCLTDCVAWMFCCKKK